MNNTYSITVSVHDRNKAWLKNIMEFHKTTFWLSQMESQLWTENDFILSLFRLLLRKQFDNAALDLDFEFFYFLNLH